MAEVTRRWTINIDGAIGVSFDDEVYRELLEAVVGVLRRHEDEVMAYDWTLNGEWRDDGRQVVMSFPCEHEWSSWDKDARIDGLADAKSAIIIQRRLHTDETDRKRVAELCHKVAIGEIEVAE